MSDAFANANGLNSSWRDHTVRGQQHRRRPPTGDAAATTPAVAKTPRTQSTTTTTPRGEPVGSNPAGAAADGDGSPLPGRRGPSSRRRSTHDARVRGSGTGGLGTMMPSSSSSGFSGFPTASSTAEHRLHALYDVTDKVIGKGAYGAVYRGTSRATGQPVAVKRIDKAKVGSKGISSLLGEVETLGMLSHPFIVKLVDVISDNTNMMIVMEYVPGGELGKVLKQLGGTLPETTVQRIALELLLAIEHFHGRGIVHRDLKLANCLVSDLQFRPAPIVSVSTVTAGTSIATIGPASHSLLPPRQSSILTSPVLRPGAAPVQGSLAAAHRAASNHNQLHNQIRDDDLLLDSARSTMNGGGTQRGGDSAGLDRSGVSPAPPLLSSGSFTVELPQRAGAATDSEAAAAELDGNGASLSTLHASVTNLSFQHTPQTIPATAPAPDPVVSVKIADFGFGVMVGDHPCLTAYCGTMQYMAPEILRQGHNGVFSYGKPVDVWALGVMVFVLLLGEHPFNGSNSAAVQDHICRGDYSNPGRMTSVVADRFRELSQNCKSFLDGLLTVDPSRRLTASEALKHPWIRAALELNEEDRTRREWIQEQLDEGFQSGVLDSDLFASIGDGFTASVSFATAESAAAASEAARLVMQRTIAGSPKYAVQRRNAVLQRFRRVALAVRAAQRLIFLRQLRRLDARPELAGIAVLRSFSFLVNGRYEPAGGSGSSSAAAAGGGGTMAEAAASYHRPLSPTTASSFVDTAGRPTIAARPTAAFRSNPKALAILLSMVEASRTVEVLNLSDIGLDNIDTVQRVARIAASHPSITHLDLSRNPVPALAGRALVRLARGAGRLRSLALHDTPLASDTIHIIQQRLAQAAADRASLAAVAASSASSASPLPPALLHTSSHTSGAASPFRRSDSLGSPMGPTGVTSPDRSGSPNGSFALSPTSATPAGGGPGHHVTTTTSSNGHHHGHSQPPHNGSSSPPRPMGPATRSAASLYGDVLSGGRSDTPTGPNASPPRPTLGGGPAVSGTPNTGSRAPTGGGSSNHHATASSGSGTTTGGRQRGMTTTAVPPPPSISSASPPRPRLANTPIPGMLPPLSSFQAPKNLVRK